MSDTKSSTNINFREQRGIVLAATRRIQQTAKGWIVPSQADANDKYVVNGDSCTCPDHTLRGVICKHVFAVRYVIQRETSADGTVTEAKPGETSVLPCRLDLAVASLHRLSPHFAIS